VRIDTKLVKYCRHAHFHAPVLSCFFLSITCLPLVTNFFFALGTQLRSFKSCLEVFINCVIVGDSTTAIFVADTGTLSYMYLEFIKIKKTAHTDTGN
jgi:hypothetical protein